MNPNPFGQVGAPLPLQQFSLGGSLAGIPILLNIILRTLIVIAGLYCVFNIIFAGYGFLSAGGDPKKIEDATSKITQSIIGLVVVAGSLVLAAIIGQILFGDPNALLQIRYFSPPPTP
jgi:hypothetical protein